MKNTKQVQLFFVLLLLSLGTMMVAQEVEDAITRSPRQAYEGPQGRRSDHRVRAVRMGHEGLRGEISGAQTRSEEVNDKEDPETRAPRPNPPAGPNAIACSFQCQELAQIQKCICELKNLSRLELSILEELIIDIQMIDSELDGLASQNDMIFSKVCIIETITDQTFSKACLIETLVESLSEQNTSETDVIVSLVDQTFSKACLIETLVDNLSAQNTSETDVLVSRIDQTFSKVCEVETAVDDLSVQNTSETDVLVSRIDQTFSKVCEVETAVDDLSVQNTSETDVVVSLIDQTFSKVCVVDENVGSTLDIASDPATLNSVATINAADISVIAWLKTIMRQLQAV